MIGWETVALEKVADIERDSVAASDIRDGTFYVGLENIQSGGTLLDVRAVDGGELASSKFAFTEEHLLYGKLRPYLAKIARPTFAGVCSTDILPIKPGPLLDRDYLSHFLRQPGMVDFANSRATGANLPRLSPRVLANFEIPLPPLPEQRRIAAILDQADTLRTQRRAALAQLDSLTQSLFLDMFQADLARKPTDTLGDLVEGFRYGTSEKSGQTGFPALRIPNVASGALDLDELKTVAVDEAEFSRLRLLDGDLLFVRTNGNPDYVGRCAVFDRASVSNTGFDPGSFIYASYLIRARLNERACTPSVLQQYLSAGEGRRSLRSHCKTSAGQYNINTEGLGAIPIPNFSFPLQQTFATRVQAIEALKAQHRAALAEADALFASLQQRAFAGTL